MLTFTGPTSVDQVQGVLDGAPRTLRILNQGAAPVALTAVRISADWVSYGLVPPDAPAPLREAAAMGSPAALDAEQQLPELVSEQRHHVWPGERAAWFLNVYWDATHPEARPGLVQLEVAYETADGEPVSRQLTFQTQLAGAAGFDGLFALDWGNATLAGAYIPRDAFVPRPIPVRLDREEAQLALRRTLAESEADRASTDDPQAAARAYTLPPPQPVDADAAERAMALGSPATLYLDDVQDKFAPIVATARAGEYHALREGPTYAQNLVQNLKRSLVNLPPYGGLTADDLDANAFIQDRYSSNAFQTPQYSLSHLARILIESTVAELSRQPRQRYSPDGRLLRLPEALGVVRSVILTYPPLLPKPLRASMRDWFTSGGLSIEGRIEWDDLTAIACHALFDYAEQRDGRLDALVRRFGSTIPLMVVDVGATGTRTARIDVTIELDGEGDDGGPSEGTSGHRDARLILTHRAIASFPECSGERLHLQAFHLLKQRLAVQLARKLVEVADRQRASAVEPGASPYGRDSRRDLATAFGAKTSFATPSAGGASRSTRAGRTPERELAPPVEPADIAAARDLLAAVDAAGPTTLTSALPFALNAAALAEREHAIPPVDSALVERVLPTRFRDPDRAGLSASPAAVAARRTFSIVSLATRRVLEAMDTGGTTYAVADDLLLEPMLSEAARRRFPALAAESDLWRGLRVSLEELSARFEEPLSVLSLRLREFLAAPLAEVDESAYAELSGLGAGQGQRLAKPDYLREADEAAAHRIASLAHDPRDVPVVAGELEGERADAPWIVLTGGATAMPSVRERLIRGLSLTGEAGLVYVAPRVWPEPSGATPDAAALGACEAEHAIASGVRVEVRDSLATLPCDFGLRTDRFVVLFPRGLPVTRLASIALPETVETPVTMWYRFTPSDDPYTIQPLGTFATTPAAMPRAERPDAGRRFGLGRSRTPAHVDPAPAGNESRLLFVNLVPASLLAGSDLAEDVRSGAWELRLTRGAALAESAFDPRAGVPLTPARRSTPLEWDLSSGIH